MIGDDWKDLGKGLGISQSDNAAETTESKMKECFEQTKNRVYWKELKYELEMLRRQDIINEITSKTLFTYGLKEYSNKLRDHYKKTLSHWNIPSAFKSDFGREHTTKDRKEAYVDLVVGSRYGTYPSDHEHFLKTHSASKKKIEIKDIVKESDGCVLIRGIAGIGKTSLIDQLVFQWADGKMLNDFDFVFKFTCRQINTITNTFTWEELVKRFFPNVYQDFFNELLENSRRVLIIVDGIDEFRYLDDIKEIAAGNPMHELGSIMHDIILERSSLLPNSKVLVCGRPQACDIIKNLFLTSQQPKLIEVSGFDENSIGIYVKKFFENNTEKIKSLHVSLNEISNLKAMAHIPVYLHIICNVYASEKKLEDLNTTTKLNIAACLVFLRDHMREFKGKNYSLAKLSQDQNIQQMVRKASQFAYKSLQEKRIFFTQDEFENECSDCLTAIEQSGIIEKVEGNDDGDFFQFKHLILQEFLSSVHIFHAAIDIKVCISEYENMRNCLPLVAGLRGILEDTYHGPNYIKRFVEDIRGPRDLGSVKCLFKAIGHELYLQTFFEYHDDNVDDVVKEYFFSMGDFVFVRYHHLLNQLIYFLKTIKEVVPKKLTLSIEMLDGKLLPNEMVELSPLLSSSVATTEHLEILGTHLTIDDISSISTDTIKLEKITLGYCELTDDHIKQLQSCIPYLKSLYLIDNYTLTATSMERISNCVIEAVNKDTNKLKEFKLSYCDLTDDHIKHLQPCIPYLKSLDLSENNTMTPTSMECISECVTQAINKNTNKLEELDLMSCKLTDDHIKQLQPCIFSLKCLGLNLNYTLTSTSMGYISKCVTEAANRNTNKLEELKLSYCELTDDHIKHLQPCIPYLRSLDLSSNFTLTPTSMECISKCVIEAFNKNTNKLEELKLSDCHLTDDHIKHLQPCIPYLRSLDLSSNFTLTPTSMECISKCVIEAFNKNTNKLEELKLGNCHLTDDHIKHLQPCIPYLKSLDLSFNSTLTPTSMECISKCVIEAFNKNTNKLEELKLSNCYLTDDHIKHLQPCIPYLKSLDLSLDFTLTPTSMECISECVTEAINKNTNKLEELKLSYCHLTDDHIKHLQPCIPYLKSLNLSENFTLTPTSMECISKCVTEAFNKNTNKLEELNLSHCNLNGDHIKHLQLYIPYLKILNLRYNQT
ncbi:NACHT, LRR and PYD domains-containing protein 4-like [Hydractinia symbiolongicarpus]|uniref:NACHT, LRR and PYD domains-containing protein 4-like n=1 Tax=Hydractinia symbiolongicarpus TaxID=13093 RepID=UPI00255085E7|nr:NACHT, LRR and PYD domains-containing protein 4-like [Hydractinia symbiolongicarpus]